MNLCGKRRRLKAVMLHFKLKRLRLCGGKLLVVDGFLLLERFYFLLNRTELLPAYLVLLKLLVGKRRAGAGFVQKVYGLVGQKAVGNVSF